MDVKTSTLSGRAAAPLRSNARISEASQKVRQRLPVADEWNSLTGMLWCEQRGVFGQHRVRQAGLLVMNSVIRLVQQRESDKPAQPALRHDAPGAAVYRVAGHSDMFDVFAPALEICREPGRREIHPQEIFPHVESRDQI